MSLHQIIDNVAGSNKPRSNTYGGKQSDPVIFHRIPEAVFRKVFRSPFPGYFPLTPGSGTNKRIPPPFTTGFRTTFPMVSIYSRIPEYVSDRFLLTVGNEGILIVSDLDT